MALLGTLTSTTFLLLTIVGVFRFRSESKTLRGTRFVDEKLPPVSVLKPVHGMEVQLRENLESFFRQHYPSYEILFAADEADDPALNLAREISARYPHIPCRMLVTGKPPWPNPPAYCFYRMAEMAAHEILVTSDSDVEVARNYLREVVAPMLNGKVGMRFGGRPGLF